VRTTVQPLGHKAQRQVDAYEYIANHHAYQGAEHPMVKISFSMSPLQVRRGVLRRVAACCGVAACVWLSGVLRRAAAWCGVAVCVWLPGCLVAWPAAAAAHRPAHHVCASVQHAHALLVPPHATTHGCTLRQVVVKELPRHWYKFLTTTCAVVGGVFTVAGILDGILHTSLASMRKKAGLGKLG
jgi:hypothetical protein